MRSRSTTGNWLRLYFYQVAHPVRLLTAIPFCFPFLNIWRVSRQEVKVTWRVFVGQKHSKSARDAVQKFHIRSWNSLEYGTTSRSLWTHNTTLGWVKCARDERPQVWDTSFSIFLIFFLLFALQVNPRLKSLFPLLLALRITWVFLRHSLCPPD